MKAAFRLMTTVRALGHDVRMLVRDPVGLDPAVVGPRSAAGRFWMRVRRHLDQRPTRGYPGRDEALFSTARLPDGLGPVIAQWCPDVVHVHWINNGFVGLGTLADLRVPQVWTAHDSWLFTGGCHYHVTCERFTAACGACPALGSTRDDDLSRHVWERKRRAYAQIRPTVVSPSTWMAERVRASSLAGGFPGIVIKNPIDRTVFTPADRAAARQRWNLPRDRRLVLFSALYNGSRNKGLHLLLPAMEQVSAAEPGIELVTVGHPAEDVDHPRGVIVHRRPLVADDREMASLLAAVEVVAVPSLSENLPFAVLEAQACGVVPVAFAIGGIPDLITHRQTGWLARPYEIGDLAAGLCWAASAEAPTAAILTAAADRAETGRVARQHIDLYTSLMASAVAPGAA